MKERKRERKRKEVGTLSYPTILDKIYKKQTSLVLSQSGRLPRNLSQARDGNITLP